MATMTLKSAHDLKVVATEKTHSSTLDLLLEVLGLSDSAGFGEPGGSVGGLGAFSTSGSCSGAIEGPLDTPGNNKKLDATKRCSEEVFYLEITLTNEIQTTLLHQFPSIIFSSRRDHLLNVCTLQLNNKSFHVKTIGCHLELIKGALGHYFIVPN